MELPPLYHLTLTMHTLFLIALERCCFFRWPSKHSEVFRGVIIGIMCGALWPFDLVIAMFPVMSWGTISYTSELLQCTVDLKEDYVHLAFWFVLVLGIPLLLGIILLLLAVHKYIQVRKANVGQKSPYHGVLEKK